MIEKAHLIRGVDVVGPPDSFGQGLNRLKKSSLVSLMYFALSYAPIGDRAVVQLLSKLPPRASILNIQSSGLSEQGTAAVTRLLPRDLREIYIRGNDIGQKGLGLLRKERDRRSAAGEPEFQLVE